MFQFPQRVNPSCYPYERLTVSIIVGTCVTGPYEMYPTMFETVACLSMVVEQEYASIIGAIDLMLFPNVL